MSEEILKQVSGSTFRKPKAEPKHAKSDVKLYGAWQDRDHELDFMDRVVSIFHSMSSECHLYATTTGNLLTVTAVMMFDNISHRSGGATFTQYQWETERRQWTVIERAPISI
jgi:hypothetical protein